MATVQRTDLNLNNQKRFAEGAVATFPAKLSEGNTRLGTGPAYIDPADEYQAYCLPKMSVVKDIFIYVREAFAAGTTAGGSNPCVVSIGGGGSGSGFGFNFSQAYNDGECQIRESVRLMSAIVKGDDPQNQIFLREVTCQSTIYWDAMERTYAETGDMRFYCDNPRPEYGKLEIRDRKHPAVHAKVRADTNISNAPGRSKHNNGFWSE